MSSKSKAVLGIIGGFILLFVGIFLIDMGVSPHQNLAGHIRDTLIMNGYFLAMFLAVVLFIIGLIHLFPNKNKDGEECPDCGEKMNIKTHTLYDEGNANRIELDFPVCVSCGHVMYDTNY